MFHFLSRMPFIDSVELALILGEAHAIVHRHLTDLLAEGIAGRVSHDTVHLPSSHRYYLTTQGIREAAEVLGFETPSDFVRAYPVSREWLTLLVRRMDAVAFVYRIAATMSPGTGARRSRVEFHRRGRFDATITLHDGRDFGVVRQGLARRRRSLDDRLRAIAEYDYSRRPDAVLILVPSAGVRLRLAPRRIGRLSVGLVAQKARMKVPVPEGGDGQREMTPLLPGASVPNGLDPPLRGESRCVLLEERRYAEQHTYPSRITHVFPDDFTERLERFKVGSGLSWAEIARRLGNVPPDHTTLEVQGGAAQLGSSSGAA